MRDFLPFLTIESKATLNNIIFIQALHAALNVLSCFEGLSLYFNHWAKELIKIKFKNAKDLK